MPSKWRRYVNRSAEARAEREAAEARKRASWDRMKAQAASAHGWGEQG